MTARAWFLFGALSLIWGLPYLLIKVAVAELPVAVLVFARVGVGALVLLPFACRNFPFQALLRHWRPLLAFAVLEFALPWGLLSHAETRITSSMAGLLMATIPAIALLVARASGDDDAMSARRLWGLALGFAGVCVLSGPQLEADQLAVLEVLGAAACYAVAAVVAGRGLQRLPALPMTAVCLALAALIYLPAALYAWPAGTPSGRALSAVAVLSVLCTSLAFVWFFALIREAGVSRAVVITYVNPAVAVAAGALVLDEPVTPWTLMAFVLILAGSFLSTRASPSPAQ